MNYTYNTEHLHRMVSAIHQMTLDVTKFQTAMTNVGRHFRAYAASTRGQRHLARVITEQPGRRIVREGLADVLEWLGEKP